MKSQGLQKYKLPAVPGVYFFYSGKQLLYIGKATSLRDRVRSYFSSDLIKTRGPLLVDMVFKADTIKWQPTDSVLEALILEAELIKKFLPHYNTKEKDSKSFLCVGITREDFPQVLMIRKKDIDFDTKTALVSRGKQKVKLQAIYGPFTQGGSLKEALKIIRRIFPFRDQSSAKGDNYEFYRQIGLTPEIANNKEQITKNKLKENYKKTIRHIKLFFEGKKKQIVRELKKEMMSLAKNQKFELANEVKRKIFSLEHINDIALIKYDVSPGSINGSILKNSGFRIEAYDIAHMSGKNMVGVMTVLDLPAGRQEMGVLNKNEYRKFIIKTQTGANDTGALEEILSRRFRHTEWGVPDLIVVDGALPQKRFAERVLLRYQLKIPVVALVKNDKHKADHIIGLDKNDAHLAKQIVLVNSEAHRFAIAFHKLKRGKNFLGIV